MFRFCLAVWFWRVDDSYQICYASQISFLVIRNVSSTEVFGVKVKLMSSHFEFRRITTICENYLKLSRSQTEHRIQGQTLKQRSLSRVSCLNRKKEGQTEDWSSQYRRDVKTDHCLFVSCSNRKKEGQN